MTNKSIKQNTIFNTIKTCSAILFPLITFPYISRVLLAENVGRINFGLSIISFFSLIASLGINAYAIRECSIVREDEEKLSIVSSQIYSINIITTVFSYILLFFTLFFYKKLEGYQNLILIQSLSILSTTLGTNWLNTAMEDFKYITIRTVFFQVVSLTLMFVFVHNPSDYYKYAIICLVSTGGASIANIWYRRRYCRVRFTFQMHFKTHAKPILFLFVMLLAQNIFNNVDSTMLGLMKGDRAVGIYSTAHKIYSIISQVVASILWVIMPRMSYYFDKGNYQEINSLLKKVLGFNMFLGLPCAVGIFLLADDIILLIAGVDFVDSSIVLKIMMIGLVFSLLGETFLGNAILLPSKHEQYYMIVCCITAVVNVIANYLLIPFYGAKAAAATTALCSLVILLLLLIKKDKNIEIRKMIGTCIAPLIGCIFISAVCLCFSFLSTLWIRVLCSISMSIVVYLGIQLLFRNEIAFILIKPAIRLLKKSTRKQ